MKKSAYLWSSLISLFIVQSANAQLPANPWDTAEFDAAIAANATVADSATEPVSNTNSVTSNSSIGSAKLSAKAAGNSWRGSGQFGELGYTGEVTTYDKAYGQEMLAPEVNNHNMNVMLDHLRSLGYKIPESYNNKFKNFTADYAKDLREAYDGLGHQRNPFDTMFSGFIDVVEDQSGLDMENILFNSIDLISRD